MKIAIDISQVSYGTGVSVYTKELVRALLSVDDENEYLLFAGVWRRKKQIHNFVNSLKGNFSYKEFLLPPRAADFLWNRLRPFSIEKLIGKVDVLHTSDWTEPVSNCQKVTTVHDLSPFLYPEETHKRVVRVFRKKINLVKESRNHVIVPSHAIQTDLIKFGISPSLIHTVYEAPNLDLLNISKIDITKKINIGKKFILAVGTAKRKNLHRIVDAFKNTRQKLNLDSLVVVGQYLEGLPQDEGVIYTGFISERELVNLYRQAQALVYVSLYEGFGLPILEGFMLGCPVVTSKVGSMEEVSGNAAVLVNPFDTDEIAAGIVDATKSRKNLIKRGKIRVKSFNWEKAATETIKVYKKAYEQKQK